MAIINGRRINPDAIGNGISGRELTSHSRSGNGRRPILENGGKVSQIDPNHYYSRQELIDKKGRGAKLSSMPDRSKGAVYARPAQSKRVITEQVIDIAGKFFRDGVDFDEDNADWLVVPNYRLPPNWDHIAKMTALMIVFPREYPVLPPIGFYMPDDLSMAHDSHFFNFAVHGASKAPIQEGWKWYCVYIHNGAWQPQHDWRYGDNLWTYFHLIREALGHQE